MWKLIIKTPSSYIKSRNFIDYWASVYTSFPEANKLDRKSSIVSAEFRENDKEAGRKLKFSGI